MSISAETVKTLRERTGAGMMECKKALTETGGDMAKAELWLREKGISNAAKKTGRVAADAAKAVRSAKLARQAVKGGDAESEKVAAAAIANADDEEN